MKKADIYYPELRKFLKSKGFNMKRFAEEVLNVDRMTLNYKLSRKTSFSVVDIQIIKDYFHLSAKQVIEFFFDKQFTK